uniref:transposase n=1 Tax=Candidatus Enterovibrio escicola TaxID=1927127 RepID=UPI0021DF514D|nr:transposase [Candidatus Enterovibrio escacola]
MSVKVTTASVDDKKPVSELADELWGCLYGEKGYISGPLQRELPDKRVTLITSIKKNMKPKVMKLWARLMLRKRFIIKTIFDQLKNISKSRTCGAYSDFWYMGRK